MTVVEGAFARVEETFTGAWFVLRMDGDVILLGGSGKRVDPAEFYLEAAAMWDPFEITPVTPSPCPPMEGMCGDMIHRGAIRVSTAGISTDVFDHGTGSIGDYDVRVGNALTNGGVLDSCDGVGVEWFDVLLAQR